MIDLATAFGGTSICYGIHCGGRGTPYLRICLQQTIQKGARRALRYHVVTQAGLDSDAEVFQSIFAMLKERLIY